MQWVTKFLNRLQKTKQINDDMNEIDISFIVPVFNVELYIADCIQSILGQSYESFELILINDGSSDGSLDICKRYANENSQITLIDIENAGVSHARNLGIKQAKGKWICFVDSDDTIDSDYLENFGFNPQEEQIDLYIQGYRRTDNKGNLLYKRLLSDNEVRSVDARKNPLIEAEMAFLINSPCFKLFKRDIISTNGLSFAEDISWMEDLMFSLDYIKHVHSIKTSVRCGYNYILRETSLTTRFVDPQKLSFASDYVRNNRWTIIKSNALQDQKEYINFVEEDYYKKKFLALMNVYDKRYIVSEQRKKEISNALVLDFRTQSTFHTVVFKTMKFDVLRFVVNRGPKFVELFFSLFVPISKKLLSRI